MKAFEIILVFSPVILEIIYDLIRFANNKTDKPLSTIFRGVYMVLLAIAFQAMDYNSWWQTLILLVFVHLAFFDWLLNLVRGKDMFYHSDKGTDRIYSRIPWYAEIFFKLLFLYSAIVVYMRLDLIIGF